MTEPLAFRNRTLVVAIVGYIYDADEPVSWSEILEVFTDAGRPWKTVEGTLYDLVAFGALHKIGKPGDRRRPDTRALKPTTLGRAWLERALVPLPTDPADLDEADAIAERLADELDPEPASGSPTRDEGTKTGRPDLTRPRRRKKTT